MTPTLPESVPAQDIELRKSVSPSTEPSSSAIEEYTLVAHKDSSLMKPPIRPSLSLNGMIAASAIIIIALASPALANESDFAFTMEHRYVSGERNKVNHSMDGGTLTVSGELWASRCKVVDETTGETTVPELVRFEVVKEGALSDTVECSFSVLPSKEVGKKVPFQATCDKISKTDIYIVAYQVKDDDGCTIEAKGKLTTK